MNNQKLAINALIQSSPILLTIGMILTFIITMLVQFFFYKSMVFPDLMPTNYAALAAGLVAFSFQFIRFALGITGASEFSRGKFAAGLAGIIISAGLAVYEGHEIGHMVSMLPERIADILSYLMYGVLWLGFFIEIRLGLNIANAVKKRTKQEQENQNDTMNLSKYLAYVKQLESQQHTPYTISNPTVNQQDSNPIEKKSPITTP